MSPFVAARQPPPHVPPGNAGDHKLRLQQTSMNSRLLRVPRATVRAGRPLTSAPQFAMYPPGKRAKTDKSLNGYQKLLKSSPQEAHKKAEVIIKNTYRTLMTRAQKGCFVYSVDPETNDYLRRMTGRPTSFPLSYSREQFFEESSRVRETPPEPNIPESKGTA